MNRQNVLSVRLKCHKNKIWQDTGSWMVQVAGLQMIDQGGPHRDVALSMGMIYYRLSNDIIKPKTSFQMGISGFWKGGEGDVRGPRGLSAPHKVLSDYHIGTVSLWCPISWKYEGTEWLLSFRFLKINESSFQMGEHRPRLAPHSFFRSTGRTPHCGASHTQAGLPPRPHSCSGATCPVPLHTQHLSLCCVALWPAPAPLLLYCPLTEPNMNCALFFFFFFFAPGWPSTEALDLHRSSNSNGVFTGPRHWESWVF